MIGYAPAAFYALTVKEWHAALRAHAHGDGHHRTHRLLADIAAMYANAHTKTDAPKVAARDFMPWIRDLETAAKGDQGKSFFEKTQELKSRNAGQ